MATSGLHFGFTHEEWAAMVEAGFAFLQEVASRRSRTDYSSFCEEVRRRSGAAPSPGDHALSFLLGDIARQSFEDHGVVLTALVHYKGEGYNPGPGFYNICQDLGLLRKGATEGEKLTFMVDHQRLIESRFAQRGRGSGAQAPV